MAVENYLDLSTRHVKPGTLECEGAKPYLLATNEYGAFLYVPEEFDDDCPEDLRRVLKYAKLEDCTLVRLDSDGPFSNDLPKYDW